MNRKAGFTLVELIAVMGIMAILFSISLIGVSMFGPKDDVDSFYEIFLTNLKQQQLYALTGRTNGQDDNSNYGIYIDSDKYVLFKGNSYDVGATDNFEIKSDDILLTSAFAQSSIVFKKDGGGIDNFSQGSDTVSFAHLHDNKQITIRLGEYGTIEEIQRN